jgi:hypothetical protein
MTEQQRDAEWNVAKWHGKMPVDHDGQRIGKLEDVYLDVEDHEPQFATVKESLIPGHLTFVGLGALKVARDELRSGGLQGAGPVRARHRATRRGPFSRRRVGPLPPLADQLRPARHGERTPTRPPLSTH